MQALLNERTAPELLDYKADLVSRVKAGLTRQVCAVAAQRAAGRAASPPAHALHAPSVPPPLPQDAELAGAEGARDLELVRAVLSLERDRARYLLKAYLRARLAKIHAHAGAHARTDCVHRPAHRRPLQRGRLQTDRQQQGLIGKRSPAARRPQAPSWRATHSLSG